MTDKETKKKTDKETDKKERLKEHPQAKWLRAIADGETLQWCNEDDEWVVLKSEYVLTLLTSKPADADLRINPEPLPLGSMRW